MVTRFSYFSFCWDFFKTLSHNGALRSDKSMIKASTLLIITVFLCGCNILIDDNRGKIALATLYNSNARSGGLDTRAFNAALSAKFSPQSSPSELELFIISVGGKCQTRTTQQLSCVIPQTTTVCLATYIDVVARINNAKISDIQVQSGTDGC
jgi:hypothetical protein